MADGRWTVAQVSQSLGWGGLERVALDLCRGLAEYGYASRAVSLSEQVPRAGQFAELGVPVEVVAQHGLDLGLPRRLARAFRQAGVDLVHAHNFGRFFYAGPAARLARLPALYTEHSNTFPSERALWLTQRRLSRWAGAVVAVSPTVRKGLLAQGLPPERVTVIPNGIDLARYAAPYPDARAELDLPAEAFVVVHVGRFVPVKNHALLLDAFALVRREVPEALLVLAGDGELRPAIEQHVETLGLGGAVRLLGVRDDVPRVLAAADVLALTSDSEGLPLAALEAMAAGRPVVATAGAGRDVVVPEQTGLLTDDHEPEAVAALLTRLARSVPMQAAFGEAARRLARERYSLEAMVAAYAEVYARLLAGKEPAARR